MGWPRPAPTEPKARRGYESCGQIVERITGLIASRSVWLMTGGKSAQLVPAWANGQPGFGGYARDLQAPVAHAIGIVVLTPAGGQISA